jgi:hypothetical protein
MVVPEPISSDPAISRHKMTSGVCRRSLLELNTLARSKREDIKKIFIFV